jgi:hypothetical protein
LFDLSFDVDLPLELALGVLEKQVRSCEIQPALQALLTSQQRASS